MTDKQITLDEIVQTLKEKEVFFSFEKASGDIRHMHATLNEDLIPETPKTDKESNLSRKLKDGTLTALPVWDTEAQGWRSFRLDSLLDFNGDSVKYAGN
jgi:hypothetical protein